jgi:cytochrome c biogenesis protein CcmG, thiol:disulfide interchange protein DsbE
VTNESLNPASPQAQETPEPPARPARSRRRIVLVAVAVLAVAIVAALAMTQGRTGSSRTVDRGGRPAPPFTLENLQPGQPPVSLQGLRGKPVVLNFWASWCGPCRREMPAFQALHESLGDKVTFIGIDNKDFRDSALKFVEETGVRYASGFDPAGTVASSYGVIGMPATFFISEDGKLLESETGEMNRDELEATISRLYNVS